MIARAPAYFNILLKKANIRMIFSQNLCFLMEQKGITRRSLSRDLDIKYTTLCDWVEVKEDRGW